MRRLLIALALLSGCAKPIPDAPSVPSSDEGFESAPERPAPGLDPTPPTAEPLRPGDVLSLQVFGATGLDRPSLIVDRGGSVHVPLAGDVAVGAVPLEQAERSVQAAIERYERFARVSLSLVEARGRYVTVVGAVERPGNQPVHGDAHLVDVIAASGGARVTSQEDRLVYLGDLRAARVVRDGARLPIDVRRALEGDPRHNVRVTAGDVVYVPPSVEGRIIVLGHVGKPRTLAYRPGIRLTEALADAGGLTRQASEEDIRIVRGGLSTPKVFAASAADVLAGKRLDPTLAPGDVIYVSEHWFAQVSDVIERVVPAVATTALTGVVLTK